MTEVKRRRTGQSSKVRYTLSMNVEVKILVPESDWTRLRDAAELGESKVRWIWFFDTAERALGADGVILRLRSGEKEGDTTAKLRGHPLAPDVVALLDEEGGLKVENDCTEDACTLAFSITREDASLSGDLTGWAWPPPRELFSRRQRALAALGGRAVPWDEVARLGPITSHTWKKKDLGLTVERWTVGAASIVEVSMRGETGPEEPLSNLRTRLGAWGVSTLGLPGGKTRWALDRLVGS